MAGIDLGTSGAKISVTSTDGTKTFGLTAPYRLVSRFSGWAEQDPHEWWEAVCGGLRRLLSEHDLCGSRVRAVGFSGQMHGLVLLDENMEVICPAILHCDTRAGEERAAVSRQELLDWGILNQAFSGFQMTSLLWLKKALSAGIPQDPPCTFAEGLPALSSDRRARYGVDRCFRDLAVRRGTPLLVCPHAVTHRPGSFRFV